MSPRARRARFDAPCRRGHSPSQASSPPSSPTWRLPEVGAAEAPSLTPGARVGRYELGRELGRGSFGVVHEARDLETGRLVAFKVVRPGKADVGADQIQREADAVAGLSHPNLVALLDAGRCEAGPWLVLELLRGRTLRERLDEGPVPWAEAVRIGLEVARGLAHAHGRGVVHRDLKPSNVFLCDGGSVRVLDFGLAHAFGRRRLEGGTPDFMAPEQWRGAPEDERTDVFALGVLLYRLLSGELPFPGGGGRGGAFPEPAPRLETPGQPGLGEAVGRMLARDPVDRPRDAAAVVALLEPLAARAPQDGSTAGSVRIRRRSRLRRRAGLAAGLAAVALLGAALARWLPGSGGAAPPPSVVVLPFSDLSAARDQGYFSEGLSDEIVNALVQVQGLKVAGRTSAAAFRGKAGDLAGMGRRLGVTSALEGSVRVDEGRVRVTARLVRLADAATLWSQDFDRDLKGVFAVQDEIAAAVVGALRVQLLGGRTPSSREFRTRDPEAYGLYLQGRQRLRRDSDGDWRQAEALLQQAVERDPDYAPAWAALGTVLFFNHGNSGPDPEALAAGKARALAAAERAVSLAPDLADGYSARGLLRLYVRRDWAGAREDLTRAVSLEPGDPDVLWTGARHVLGPSGQLPLALAHARRAAELDPLSYKPWFTLAVLHLAAGQLPEARAAAQRSLELEPRQDSAVLCLVSVALRDGRAAEALALAGRSDEPVVRLLIEAMARHAMGDRARSDAALAALVARHAHEAPYQVAVVHAARGDAAEAFRWLERALEENDGGLLDLGLEPAFAPLRTDPRYAAVAARMGLPAGP